MFEMLPASAYSLARAFHIIAVIAWMAGLLMLPRFYAYWAAAEPEGELARQMAGATARLRKIILTPALIAAWLFGLFLLVQYNAGGTHDRTFSAAVAAIQPWMWLKLALVLGLTALHGVYVAQGRKLAAGKPGWSAGVWRLMNEVPFVIAIIVVILATVEPFPG